MRNEKREREEDTTKGTHSAKREGETRKGRIFVIVVMFSRSLPCARSETSVPAPDRQVLRQIPSKPLLIRLRPGTACITAQPVASPFSQRRCERSRRVSHVGTGCSHLKRGVSGRSLRDGRLFALSALHVATAAPETGTRFSWRRTRVFANCGVSRVCCYSRRAFMRRCWFSRSLAGLSYDGWQGRSGLTVLTCFCTWACRIRSQPFCLTNV